MSDGEISISSAFALRLASRQRTSASTWVQKKYSYIVTYDYIITNSVTTTYDDKLVYHCGWWQWPPGNFKPNIRTWDWSDLVYKISVIHMSGKWSLPKELEVQRDTNVARLQTTTIYNFFNKHLDRWRIKEYTSSQSMYNVMSLNFLRSSNVSCFSTKKHTHQVTFKSPENTIEATRKCCGWWFGNLLGHRDRLSICWVSFGFRFFSVDHGLGIPGGEWLMGEDGGYYLPWNESKLDELRFLGFLFNLLDECFFFSGFLVVRSVSRNRWSFRRFLSKTRHHCEASISINECKNNLKNKHKFCNMFWFFCEEVAFVSCFYLFTFLQPKKICGSAVVATTWGNEGFMEISTWNRSPGDFCSWPKRDGKMKGIWPKAISELILIQVGEEL